MYERVMVPLDGSEFAERALRLATGVVARPGAALHLVAVAVPSGPTSRELESYLSAVAGAAADEVEGA